MTKNAVILVAGMSKRMGPLTADIPKCLLKVNEQTVLENALHAFSEAGVSKVLIVVGYLLDVVKAKIGDSFLGMKITYINNEIYEKTNSMYSLYLGLENLSESTWVLEGDVFFEPDILKKKPEGSFCWFVDRYNPEMDGAFLTCNRDDYATSLQIIREKNLPDSSNLFKSIGILHLNPEGIKHLKNWLSAAISEDKVNLYYDLIVAEHIGTLPIRLVDINGMKWYEIDDSHDLKRARELFA